MTDMKSDTNLLYDRVRYARSASAVERCHVMPHTLRYSVGHHTHDVVSLLILTWQAAHGGELPRAELIVAGHKHDLPERITGDFPSTIKDLLNGALDKVEANIDKWLGLDVELTEEETLYLEAADRFELYLWAKEEAARGATNVLEWIDWYVHKWQTNPLPWPFMELLDEVQCRGVGHLGNQQMADIAGL